MTIYQEKFNKEVAPLMKKEFGYKNILAVPHITKVVLNCGIGKMLISNPGGAKDLILKIEEALKMITGQKPAIRSAKQSISSFKLREGAPVGYVVTLRGRRMEDFIIRFINMALPRTRDFWGIPLKNFDERGNLNYGVREHIVFPEVSQDSVVKSFGFELTFVTNAQKREEAIRLFKLLGFPIKD